MGAELRKMFKSAGIKPRFVSAATSEGVEELMEEVVNLLQQHPLPVLPKEEMPELHPKGMTLGLSVEPDGDAFIIHSPGLERMVAGSDVGNPEVRRQIGMRISSPRLKHVIERAGIKAGDKIRIGNFEWIW